MKRPIISEYHREIKRVFPDSIGAAQYNSIIELLKAEREVKKAFKSSIYDLFEKIHRVF